MIRRIEMLNKAGWLRNGGCDGKTTSMIVGESGGSHCLFLQVFIFH